MSTQRRKPAADRLAADPELGQANKILLLIEAAADIFLAKGYYKATMSDVAKAAGMSKKTVYQLIESKAGLFAALLAHHRKNLVPPKIRDTWSVEEILVQHLLSLARFLFAPEQISIIRLIMAEYTHSTDFGRAFHQKKLHKAKTSLENCLQGLRPPPGFKTATPKEMAAVLFGMALGEFYMAGLIGIRPTPNEATLTRRVRLAVEMFLMAYDLK